MASPVTGIVLALVNQASRTGGGIDNFRNYYSAYVLACSVALGFLLGFAAGARGELPAASAAIYINLGFVVAGLIFAVVLDVLQRRGEVQREANTVQVAIRAPGAPRPS